MYRKNIKTRTLSGAHVHNLQRIKCVRRENNNNSTLYMHLYAAII